MRFLVCVCLLLTGCKQTRPAAPITPSDQQAAAAEVARAQLNLLAEPSVSMDTDVPAAVRPAISQLKNALAVMTDAVVAALPADTTAQATQQKIAAHLPVQAPPSSKPAVPDDDNKPFPGAYGDQLQVAVTSPMPGLLLIQETFQIECGEDNLLLAYRSGGGRWQRVLRWQAPVYAQVSGAFGDIYETRLLQPLRNGNPVLLVLHGTPWCTSTMSGFGMDTFELKPDADTEKPFWHGFHGYRRADDDPPFSLKVTPDGFEVRANVNDWTGAIMRKGVMRYRLTPASVERTLPIAMNARESVEEWLSMPRDEAMLFTDAPARSGTWQMFDVFSDAAKPEGTPSMRYGEVHACVDSPKHFQVEIGSTVYSRDNKTHAAGPSYFVQVEETGKGYRLHRTSPASDPACRGRVVMAAAL